MGNMIYCKRNMEWRLFLVRILKENLYLFNLFKVYFVNKIKIVVW